MNKAIPVEPWPPQQQVVRCIGINDVASHFRLQIADSANEPDLPEGGRTVRVEPRYNRVGGAQPASGDHEIVHDSQWHDAQSGTLVDLNTIEDGGPDVPREIERAIMHAPDLQVFI